MISSVAVLLPARNESKTIGGVIDDFRRHLPSAEIVVCDNASTDNTASIAREAGARVIFEVTLGKAHAMARLFYEVDADIYVMADADGTYDASVAQACVLEMRQQNIDMLIVSRRERAEADAFRPMHRLGNWIFTTLFKLLFDSKLDDVLSGYRFLSRRFVKSLPVMSNGFEIEVEMTALACACNQSICSIQAPYKQRTEGSFSKLRTVRDGFKILRRCLGLILDYRPFLFFSAASSVLTITSLIMFYPIWTEYLSSGTVPRLPTAMLCLGMMLASLISFQAGMILNGVTRSRIEKIKLQALLLSAPPPKKKADKVT